MDHALRIFVREWYAPSRGDKTILQVMDEIDAMLERAVRDEPPALRKVQ